MLRAKRGALPLLLLSSFTFFRGLLEGGVPPGGPVENQGTPGEARRGANDAEGASRAGDGAAPGKEAPPPQFFLRNATRITGMPRLEALTVETSYGALKIPIAELIAVRFAPRLDPDREEALRGALARLGSAEESEREAALAALRDAGSDSLPLLKKAMQAEDERTRKAAGELHDTLLDEVEKQPREDDDISPLPGGEVDDEIVARRFTVRGRVVEAVFSIETRYGVLEAKRPDLIGIIFPQSGKSAAEAKVQAVNTVPGAWLKTKLTIGPGQKLQIRATGQMQQPNYGIVAGPEGTTQQSGSTFGSFPMLSLVGKIGKNGKPFLVGREYRGKANGSGQLYLGIVPFRRNYAASGSFDVKIQVLP
jgi:hypothetical protein